MARRLPRAGGCDLAEAVEVARKYLKDLEAKRLIDGPIKGLVLEEFVEGKGKGGVLGPWTITLGYRTPSPIDEIGGTLAYLQRHRSDVFKVFTIDRITGHVVSMKNRDPKTD